MKGKNYSCNNKVEKRKTDFYQTPYSITRHLLNNETFDYNLKVLEPCGNNAIVKILKRKME